MSEGQFGAQGATTTPAEAESTSASKKTRNAIPQPYQEGDGTWSVRTRREGVDIYVSGLKSKTAASRELVSRLNALAELGKPHGKGPDQTTVAKAMQEHALSHLPSLKGAAQEARRINKYLRAARLATIELCPTDAVQGELPRGAVVGRYFAVWLVPHTDNRAIPGSLRAHRRLLLTKTAGSDRVRAVLANKAMAQVTKGDVQGLIQGLEAEGLACATVLQEQHLLRRLFKHAVHVWNWPKPAKNPAQGLKVAGEPNKRERVMSLQEQQQLDEAVGTCLNDLVGPAFALLTETAMRAEECIDTARWGDVDWERSILHLRHDKTNPNLGRDVPLSPKALEILRALGPGADPEEKIFGITYESLKAGWRRACERANVTNLRIQDLRHTAATRMALKSGNVFIVQKLTGHRTLDMVNRYVNVKAEDVVEVMRRPDPQPQAARSDAPAPMEPNTNPASKATADVVAETLAQLGPQLLAQLAAQMKAAQAQAQSAPLPPVKTAEGSPLPEKDAANDSQVCAGTASAG